MTATLMRKPLDAHEAIRLLREVVAGRETFVYQVRHTPDGPVCDYYRNGEPSCVVGHVFHRWNPELQMPEAMSPVLLALDGTITDDAARVLYTAQDEQDEGRPWGEALAAAEGVYLRCTGGAA